MCCSMSPGVPVRFSDTVLYAADVIGPTGALVHVLGYRNKVQNRPRSSLVNRSPTGNSGNAMILPFPAIPGTMGQANVLETKRCRDILQDIADSVSPTLRSLRLPPKNASRAKKACASAIANRSPRPSRPTSGARSSAGDMPRKCPTVTSCANWRMCTEATLSRRERGRPAHQRRLAAEPSRDEMKPQKSSRGPVVPN
jgi:hypothetical protein